MGLDWNANDVTSHNDFYPAVELAALRRII